MLVSAFAGSGIVAVQSEEYYFTLYAVIPSEGYPYYCPRIFLCREIFAAMKYELAKIGINLVIVTVDPFTWWYRVWDIGWNKTYLEGGWDLICLEWWMMPTGLLWLEPLVYSWLTPPEGYNIFPWLDETADKLLWKGMHKLNATERKIYLWKWQEWFMHNPPMANLYYPRLHEVTAVWVEGWDAVVRFRDISHLAINETLFAEYAPEWRKAEPNTLMYGVDESVWGLNPLFVETITEEWMCDLQFETLYDLSIDPWPPTGQEPPLTDFCSKPVLAAEPPIFMEGPNGPGSRARVLLRDDVYWSDGVKFNATDVKFTFDLVLHPMTRAVARSDLLPVVESVEIVNETCVDFILYEPYADLATLLSDDRGLAIIPYHTLRDVPFLRTHPSNVDFLNSSSWLPVTGPFKMTEIASDDHITFERNPNYFGYDIGWGPHNVTKIIFEWVPDPANRLMALINHDIDFGEYTLASVAMFKDLQARPDLRVWQYDSPSSNVIFFNLDHPILSNRYVRMAIAHAIPYEYIFDNILPAWGIETAYRGLTPIIDAHYYTDANNVTVHLYNDHLWPYEYNITRAQKYMDMWYYSRVGADHTKGPVGDADFNGFVELDDFYIWIKWFGYWSKDPRPITPPQPKPGHDEDADFDNNGYIEMYDFYKWREHWGFYYPENSTKHEWSR